MASPGLDAAERVVGTSGYVYVGETTATAPSDADSALDNTWYNAGYIDDSGAQITDGKRTQDIPVWQSFYPLDTLITEKSFALKFSLVQWNDLNVAFAFGGALVTGSGSDFTVEAPDPADGLDYRSVTLDVFMTDTNIHRWYLPRVIVSENVEVVYRRSALALMPITVAVLPTGTDPAWTYFAHDSAFSAT